MKNKSKSDRIISCLQKEQACYNELLAKMKIQKQAVEEEDESRWLTVIHENDGLIEVIRQLDEEIEQIFYEIPKAERETLMRQTENLKNQIETFLREIMALDGACRNVLESKKGKVSDQMKMLKEGTTMLRGYGTATSKSSFFSKNV